MESTLKTKNMAYLEKLSTKPKTLTLNSFPFKCLVKIASPELLTIIHRPQPLVLGLVKL